MHKKIAILAITGLVLTGCQSIQDQLGSKLAEGIINSSTNGQVKVNLDDLKNGKVTVQTKDGTIQTSGNGTDGGTLKVTDTSGKTLLDASGNGNSVVVKDATGKTSTFSGDSGAVKPANISADLPSLDNGTNFIYFSSTELSSLTFDIADTDYKAVCQKEMSALEGVGWIFDTATSNIEATDTWIKNYTNVSDNLTLSCVLNQGKTSISLQRSPKSN